VSLRQLHCNRPVNGRVLCEGVRSLVRGSVGEEVRESSGVTVTAAFDGPARARFQDKWLGNLQKLDSVGA